MVSSADNDPELLRAVSRHRAGHVAEAEVHYRNFLRDYPEHGGANHNLGLLLSQRGEAEAGLQHLRTALEADPSKAQYWLSYAKRLLSAGRREEAVSVLGKAKQQGLSDPGIEILLGDLAAGPDGPSSQGDSPEHLDGAIARDPDNAELFFRLGNALVARNRIEDAIAAYRRTVALKPGHSDAHFRLGSLLSENGRIADGFAHYMQRAQLVYGSGSAPAPDRPEPAHKSKHDREQADYLGAPLQTMFHLADGDRLATPAINPANANGRLLEQWTSSRPQMIVMDDFLTPEALEKLRSYCAASTVWRRIYDAGYIGATPEDGLACPLMAQIAEEISTTFPEIVGPHRFKYLGAFKYDSELSTGTNIHADNAAVNVNFYIAPDEANLDPESGGMDIWDVAVGSDAEMRRLNGHEAAAREFLARSGARMTRIGHRANRAVIFKSDLVHKTSDCRFKEGYLNKRINISLLFGDRISG